jgi:cytochrome c oxidase subunit II
MIHDFPETISSYGPGLDYMFDLILWITGFFFVAMEGYLLYLVVRYAFRKGQKAEYEHGTKAQIVWLLVFAVVILAIDLMIDIKGAPTWHNVKEQMPATDMTIKVAAKQFDWTFIYPGKDGALNTADDVSSYRELHVPVGKKVKVILTSQDVLHSFFLPEVRLKQDVLPGREIPQWFDTNKVGNFNLVCSELCGLGHTRMMGALKVHEEKEFQTWLAQLTKEQHEGGAQ